MMLLQLSLDEEFDETGSRDPKVFTKRDSKTQASNA